MTHHEQGQRIALAHTTNPDHPQHPGQQGVVLACDPPGRTVVVAWDDGTVSTLRPGDGDRLDILAPPPIGEAAWRQRVLATEAARGSGDGGRAAEQWIDAQASRDPGQLRDIAGSLDSVLDHLSPTPVR